MIMYAIITDNVVATNGVPQPSHRVFLYSTRARALRVLRELRTRLEHPPLIALSELSYWTNELDHLCLANTRPVPATSTSHVDRIHFYRCVVDGSAEPVETVARESAIDTHPTT
jgi:hypothetical protein